MDDKAFSGLKVFDASQGIAGPHATMLLAAHGADVVKLEPLEGDWARVLGRQAGQETIHYLAYNLGKRSIALDLKSPAGLEAARRLAIQSDIFLESFRPGVMARLGLGYEDIKKLNPNIIYASISGYGQTGPNAKAPATDALIQGYSGMMRMNHTDDGRPHRNGMIVVDALTGLYAFEAISAAMLKRFRFGGGAYLDISLVQAAGAFQSAKIMEFVDTGGKTMPLYVPSGMYETSDGFVVINGMRPSHFASVCNAVECHTLAQDPRWQTPNDRLYHLEEINGALRAAFKRYDTETIISRLRASSVMVEKVQSYGEWLAEEHVKASGFYRMVETSGFGPLPIATIPGVPGESPNRAPDVGEHTRAVLAEVGFDDAWVDEKIAAGAFVENSSKAQLDQVV